MRRIVLVIALLAIGAIAGSASAMPSHTPRRPAMVQFATMPNPLGPPTNPTNFGPIPRVVSFSANGRFLAVAGEVAGRRGDIDDCRVGVWDVRSKQRVALLTEEGADNPDQVALSSDGALVALGADRGTFVWSVSEGRLLVQIPGECSALTFTGTGQRLLLLRTDSTLVTWDHGHTRLRRIRRARDLIMGAFLADNRCIIGLRQGIRYDHQNADWDVVFVNSVTGKARVMSRVLRDGRMQYFSVAPKTGWAAVFEWWKSLTRLVSPMRRRYIVDLKKTFRWSAGMALSPDGRFLLFGDGDGSVLLADSITGHDLRVAYLGVSFIDVLCWSPDGTQIAAIANIDEDKGLNMMRVWRIVR